jgi:hypothetical protein
MRRTALLPAALIAGLGLLAGCDLPGGSAPRALLPDQVPNNSPEDAPTLQVPSLIHGTVDPGDTGDYYRLAAPSQESGLYVTCTGDVSIEVDPGTQETVSGFAPCDGQEYWVANVEEGASAVIGVLGGEGGFTGYALTVRFGAATA